MKAKINDRFSYSLSSNTDVKILHRKESFYQIRNGDEVYDIELLQYDVRGKYAELAIDGFVFQVDLQDDLDDVIQLIRQKSAQASGSEDILAPIPGLIKEINRDDGTAVEQGESLLVLEAMKMENTIQAPVAANQIQYHVSEGDHVVKGQKLLTLRVES